MVFLLVLAFLLLASPDVPVVSGAAVTPPVAVVLSAVNIPGVLAVIRVSFYPVVPAVVEITAVAIVPFVVNMLPTFLAPLLLLACFCCSRCLLCCCRAWYCWIFPGFTAVARVSSVAAFPTAVEFSYSAYYEYSVQAKLHSPYTQRKLNLIPFILSNYKSNLIPLKLSTYLLRRKIENWSQQNFHACAPLRQPVTHINTKNY